MDQELKALLVEMERNLAGQLAELRADMAGMKGDVAGLKAGMAAMKQELLDHSEAVETRLLTEFWKWARTADARYRQSIAVVTVLDERVQAVEDRVADLERKRAS